MYGRITEKANNGYPFATNISVKFARADVAAFGKKSTWGYSPGFLVRLRDGRVVSIRIADQNKEDEKWLRKLSRKLSNSPHPTEETRWFVTWLDLCSLCPDIAVAGYDGSCEKCWTEAAMNAY